MGATRMKFIQAERTHLQPRMTVEVRHGSHWRRAEILSDFITTDSLGMQYVDAVDISPSTRTASYGERIRIYSKQFRPVGGW